MALRGIVASLLFLLAATPAHAATVTKTLRAGPFRLDGFETLRPRLGVPAPRTDGYITHMDAWLVRRDGRRVPIRRVMMHHVVFLDRSVDPNRQRTTCEARTEQPFYGTGEEREKLELPSGYGYRVRANDRWRMQTMLMSHGLTAQTVFVQYRMRIVTGRR